MANVITYGVTLDASGAINGFKRLDTAIQQSGREIATLESRAKQLGTMLGVSLVGGLAAAGLALRKVVAESSEAQRVQAQLAAGLRSTGNASGQTIQSLNRQAEALSRLSTFSDEAIGSAQSILLTFTKLSGQTFPRATSALVDMATRMGGDLSGAAVQLGKALNDPVQGITALTRVGVSFTASQKETIKSLAETNRLAEAQAMILKELESEFGGSAAAAANTLGGALTRLSNEWGNLFEVSQESSSGVIRAINAIADALPRLRTGLGFAANMLTGGALRASGLMGSGEAPSDVQWSTPSAQSTAALRAQGEAIALAAEGERERRAAFDEAKRNAAERERWETDAILRAVRLAQTRALAELPSPGGQSNIALGRSAAEYGNIGRGVRSLPSSMRTNPSGMSFAQVQAKEQAATSLAWQAEMQRRNAQIADNFLENMQRSVGGIVADLASGGKIAISDVWSTFRRIGAQALGETVSAALARAMGGKAGGGGFMGTLGTVLGIGSLLVGVLGSRGRSQPREEQFQRLSPFQAAELDRQRAADRDAARPTSMRSGSLAGALTENTASRLFGTFDAMVRYLASIDAKMGVGGSLTGGGSAAPTAAAGTGLVASLNRALGADSQMLRLRAGVAVMG